MPTTKSAGRIDTLMEKASAALAAGKYFQAEREALNAIQLARQAEDFERMARITLPLQEARRQRVQAAIDLADAVQIIDAQTADEISYQPGCVLVQPPRVGADARRLRIEALADESPLVIVAREPTTQLGLVPVVALTQGLTVRIRIDPPDPHDAPDVSWVLGAVEALGDSVIDDIDPELDSIKRIDLLLLALEALPEHEKLHQELEAACRTAHTQTAAAMNS